jgi:hypothetical protein
MRTDSIVVMEQGADWPAWVDEEAGPVSNVVVLSRQHGESQSAFEARARLRLDSMAEIATPSRAVLVCARIARAEARQSRAVLLRALVETLRRAGGGELTLAGDADSALSAEITAYAGKLNRRTGAGVGLVNFRCRVPPAASLRSSRVA